MYFVRLKMSNSQGEAVQTTYAKDNGGELGSFTTGTAKPVIEEEPTARNRTVASARLAGAVFPHGSKTHWRFEYASSAIGPWTVASGGGTISQAQAEATPYGGPVQVGASLGGLVPATTYYVRLFVENAAGEGEYCHGPVAARVCEAISAETQLASFETLGPPSVMTFAVHTLVGEAFQLDGGVDPKSTPTSAEQTITVEGAPTGGTFTLTFNGHETGPIAYNAPANESEGSGSVVGALHAGSFLSVEGPPGGPYTVIFEGGGGGVGEPQIEANGSGLTPSGKVTVHTDFKGGETTETHYRFQYVSAASFAEHGWAGAEETPEATAPPNGELEVVSAALPALSAGETYRYRVLASTSAGVVEGAEQTLSVPRVVVEPAAACPNEAFRTGLSAHLPDCRAYEQLSPVDKSGSQEPFQYLVELGSNVLVGEQGENAVLDAPTVNWGTGPAAGASPYFFSREAQKGWKMTAGAPQPETGVQFVKPQLYSPDLTQVAFEARYQTSALGKSGNVEYKVGFPGGPYTTVASVPGEPQEAEGWVAANASFSKLIFQTRDRGLLGELTGTHSGGDLYEYTVSGGLRQLNVSGEPAVTIGSCGAVPVKGVDEQGGHVRPSTNPHSVSADGSRVLFEAVPSRNCAEPAHLYMRVNGSETVDIGVYEFLGASVQGTRLLLQDSTGALLAYDTETHAAIPQSAGELAGAKELALLGIPDRVEAGEGTEAFAHPRYTYWGARNHYSELEDGHAYRYDSVEHVVQCISCASSFDPNPKQPAFMSSNVGVEARGEVPVRSSASANGEFAFFTTPAALLPQDVDGEISVEINGFEGKGSGGLGTQEYEDVAGTTSPSSDIYEWRAAGVNGCGQMQGCLALITDGRGGYKNILLGTADEGRDVLIYTRSTLLPQVGRAEGTLGEGNIYDARVGGGFAPVPPRPTECEGDACATPPGAPVDATPSSLTFSGNGNLIAPAPGKPALKAKKPKTKKKSHHKKRKKRKAKRAGHGTGRKP
jgi:hypothetical protein